MPNTNPDQKFNPEQPRKPEKGKTLKLTLLDSDRVQIMFGGMKIIFDKSLRLHFEQKKDVEPIIKDYMGTPQLAGIKCPIEHWLKEIERFSPNPPTDKQKFLNEINQMKRKKGDNAEHIMQEMNKRMEREKKIHPSIKKSKKSHE